MVCFQTDSKNVIYYSLLSWGGSWCPMATQPSDCLAMIPSAPAETSAVLRQSALSRRESRRHPPLGSPWNEEQPVRIDLVTQPLFFLSAPVCLHQVPAKCRTGRRGPIQKGRAVPVKPATERRRRPRKPAPRPKGRPSRQRSARRRHPPRGPPEVNATGFAGLSRAGRGLGPNFDGARSDVLHFARVSSALLRRGSAPVRV